MSLFPAFSRSAKSAPDTSTSNNAVETSSLFPSTSCSTEQKNIAEPLVSSFSFSFDAKEHNEVKAPRQQAPEIIDVLSSDDDVVLIGTQYPDNDKVERKRKRKEKRKHEKKKRRNREKERPVEQPKLQQTTAVPVKNPKVIFLKDAGVKPEDAFCLDPNADVINLTFDTTYWKNVPKYTRPPRWTLGPRKDRNFRRLADGRYFQDSKELRSLRSSAAVRVVVPEDCVPFGRNYIPLSDTAADQVPEEETEVSDEFRDRTAVFNEKLRKDPGDVALWLELLRFQDDVVRNYYSGTTEKEDQAKLSHNGLLQRKISILERAIESNPTSTDLQFRRLAMCEDIWDKDQLNNEWRQFAFSHPNDPYIWRQYLFFLQSHFTTFSFARIHKAYEKYLSLARGISEGTFQSHKALENHDFHTAYFPHFLSEFWMQSGHQEKAVALQQAWIELNLSFPAKLDAAIPLKEGLVFMEPFWDSGVVRFGEKNALGWTNSMTGAGPMGDSGPADFSEEENAIVADSSSVALLWIKLEKFRQEHYLLPYHGTDDIIDPERMVLLDDIRPFLFRFPRIPANEAIFCGFITNFLVLLRCPVLRNFSTEGYGWQALMSSFEQSPSSFLFAYWSESHFSAVPADSCCHSLFLPYHTSWTDQDLVINGIFEQAIPFFTGIYATYLSICWLQYKLSRFHSLKSDSAAFKKEIRSLAKSLLKKPENRNNLLIWEWYAFAEGQLEAKTATTIKTLETVMESTPLKPDDLGGTFALARVVRYYVETCLGVNSLVKSTVKDRNLESDRKRALIVLLRFSESQTISFKADQRDVGEEDDTLSKHRILRCQIAFNHFLQQSENLDQADTSKVHAFGSLYCNTAMCFALFDYLANGLDAGLTTLQNAVQHCRINSADGSDFDLARERSHMDWEILTEASVRLALFHQRNFTLSSTRFREILLTGLSDFPNNPCLLLIFTLAESSYFISGRLRGYFDDALESATTSVPWIFAIYAEYERRYRLWRNLKMAVEVNLTDELSLTTFKDTGMANKLRALFERAVESRICRHAPLIWRIYLKFEMDEENLRRAEGIYFRAMQACPWAKAVFVDAIKHFPHRVQEILDVVVEKELRVVAPFDEVELLFNSKALVKTPDKTGPS